MSRIFKPVSSGWATMILSLATLLSYAMGLVRDLLLSYYFGASADMDVYNTAFLIPDLIFNFTIAAALASVFLPTFREVYLKDKVEGEKLAGSFMFMSQFFVIIICVIAFFGMPHLVDWLFSNASIEQQKQIVNFSRILLVSPVLFGISNTLGVVAMSFKHYVTYALSPGLYNLGIIAGILIWGKELGVVAAIYGVLIGLVLHLGIRFFDLRKLHEFDFRLQFWRPDVWQIFKLSLPRSFGLMVWQINAWIYSIIGYSLAIGSIAAFNYARNLQSFAVSMFGIAVATAVFPFLVDHKVGKETEDLKNRIQKTFIQILIYTFPAAVGLSILNVEAIEFLFGRGEFAAQGATVITASILFYLALAIPFESLTHLLSRVFYAFKNTLIPVLVNLVFLAINLGGSLWFAKQYGAQVFGITFLIASFMQVSLLLLLIGKYVKLDKLYLLIKSGLVVLFSLVMGAMVYLLKVNFESLHFLILVLSGVIFYIVLLWNSSLREYMGVDLILKKFK